jgi:uncharacterized FAD-dependent dehydrogenase
MSSTELELELDLFEPDDEATLRAKAARRLGLNEPELPPLRVRKRSLDCRRGRVRFHLVCEIGAEVALPTELGAPHPVDVRGPRRVVIVGDGPCGLFCAYQLARLGIACLVVERGKRVQPRRRDLKGLTRRHTVDPDSNYCFGEGGAGTYSDGKLYTRSHKRGDVRDVIEILALHGAPSSILTDARPHIGSNLLPQVVTALRERLEAVGVEFRFETRLTEVLTRRDGAARVSGVRVQHTCASAPVQYEDIEADCVVLATGHSARDVFDMLQRAGHPLEAKPFALGVRIEHPQALINEIQYGASAGHPKLPSAAYKVAFSRAVAGQSDERGVFSFCMCPGGFIVPAATAPSEVVVNGMSPSRRNSKYANSGLVVSVQPEEAWAAGHAGSLAGVRVQERIERAACAAAGGTLAAPAVRVTDYLSGRVSQSLPACSYMPGIVPSELDPILDASGVPFAQRLREGLRHFGKQMRGFISSEAVLVGVESRTSSPVRIPRDPDSLCSPHWKGLYPGGEGGGYAGGIMSAAVDGMRIARALAQALGSDP